MIVQYVVKDDPVNREYISLANGSAVISVPVFCRAPARIPKGETIESLKASGCLSTVNEISAAIYGATERSVFYMA